MTGIDGAPAIALSDYVNDQFDQALSWESLDRSVDAARSAGLKVVLKGIQRVDDAESAVAHGVDAIELSKPRRSTDRPHAGSVQMVAGVRDAVGSGIALICDGGIRRGSDVVKAIALGADAVMVGRPYLYGLGAGGERGVSRVLDHIVWGLRQRMALCGRATVGELTADLVTQQS